MESSNSIISLSWWQWIHRHGSLHQPNWFHWISFGEGSWATLCGQWIPCTGRSAVEKLLGQLREVSSNTPSISGGPPTSDAVQYSMCFFSRRWGKRFEKGQHGHIDVWIKHRCGDCREHVEEKAFGQCLWLQTEPQHCQEIQNKFWLHAGECQEQRCSSSLLWNSQHQVKFVLDQILFGSFTQQFVQGNGCVGCSDRESFPRLPPALRGRSPSQGATLLRRGDRTEGWFEVVRKNSWTQKMLQSSDWKWSRNVPRMWRRNTSKTIWGFWPWSELGKLTVPRTSLGWTPKHCYDSVWTWRWPWETWDGIAAWHISQQQSWHSERLRWIIYLVACKIGLLELWGSKRKQQAWDMPGAGPC